MISSLSLSLTPSPFPSLYCFPLSHSLLRPPLFLLVISSLSLLFLVLSLLSLSSRSVHVLLSKFSSLFLTFNTRPSQDRENISQQNTLRQSGCCIIDAVCVCVCVFVGLSSLLCNGDLVSPLWGWWGGC